MKLWEQTLSVFFLLLCGRSLIVSSFQPEELYRIKSYVRGAFTFGREYAYVAKFTQNECNRLTQNVVENALREDMAKIDSAINRDREYLHKNIYEGTRMVMASFENRTDGKHAEYRLLFPNNTSPAQKLLNRRPAAGCAVFYTYLSPCLDRCTEPLSKNYTVIQLTEMFEKLEDKAFVYSKMYSKDQERYKQIIRMLKLIDFYMPVFRCDLDCIKCFTNGKLVENCAKLSNNRDHSPSPNYRDGM